MDKSTRLKNQQKSHSTNLHYGYNYYLQSISSHSAVYIIFFLVLGLTVAYIYVRPEKAAAPVQNVCVLGLEESQAELGHSTHVYKQESDGMQNGTG